MIQSFIAFKQNNQSLQPLLKVEQGFKNTVSIHPVPGSENIISFYLCCRENNAKKGSVLKIGQSKLHASETSSTNVTMIAGIPSENEFSVAFCAEGKEEVSIPEIIKLPATSVTVKTELPYGSFIYKKLQEIADAEEPEVPAPQQTELTDVLPGKNDFLTEDISAASDAEPGTEAEQEPAEANAGAGAETAPDAEPLQSAESAGGQASAQAVQPGKNQIEDDYYELADKSAKVRAPLSLKLIAIISLLVIVALGSITALVSYFITGDVQISAEENNMTINSRTASDVQNRLETIYNNTQMMLELLEKAGDNSIVSQQITASFFSHNNFVAAVYIPGIQSIENTKFFLSNGISAKMSEAMIEGEQTAIQNAEGGAAQTINVSPYYTIQLIASVIPVTDSANPQYRCVIILFSTDALSDAFESESINSSFIVNNSGYVLSHPDANLVLANADMSSSPIIAEMLKNSDTNRQMLYTDTGGTEFFGAYRKIAEFGISVITIVESKTVFEAIRATTRRNIYLTAAVLFLSILLIWFFAKSITTPVKALASASKKIANGDFKINLTAHTHDEIGLLTTSFTQMGNALDTFGRFTNKLIAVKAMKGEITLGGETKTATLFFSDIRSFTAISEKLSAEEVVFFLNDYMTRMVTCVEKTGGTVDKFIGDAVMAHWGAASSTGSVKSDALNSVRTALMMRAALREFNTGRGGDKKPIIRIGCGINTGSVVAGQIGSNERMEYTCIGDTVNFASRTESLNKPLGTDILLTENTYELVKDEVLVEQMPSVTVKGKEKPVHMYALINMPGADDIPGAGKDGPKTVQEVRDLLGIPTPDLTGVNLDEDEKKYKIQGK